MQAANAKRRSTMNSRDAAYDEEEQLRRAIEASRGEKREIAEGITRRGKRSRSDSEECVISICCFENTPLIDQTGTSMR